MVAGLRESFHGKRDGTLYVTGRVLRFSWLQTRVQGLDPEAQIPGSLPRQLDLKKSPVQVGHLVAKHYT